MACKTCPPTKNGDCDCPVKDLNTDCSTYKGTLNLSHIGTTSETILTQVLININNALGNLKDSLASYFQLGNVGSGAAIFKGISNLGIRQLKSLTQGNNVEISTTDNEIEFSVPETAEDTLGVIQLATQTEVNAGIDSLKAVTPATLKTYVEDPDNSNNASTTERGVIELATQAEVNAGTDVERAVTPSTLSTYVTEEISNPDNLPDATTSTKGIIEIATLAETIEETSSSLTVTPVTAGALIDLKIEQIPSASTTEEGLVELATTAEANTLTDTSRAVTPGTIPIATQSQRGISEFATLAEASALSNTDKVLTPGVMPSAGFAQKGLVELATTAETITGTDASRAVTPAGVQAAIDAQPTGLQSTTLSITTWSKNVILTPIAHGLGVIPSIVQVRVVCTNATEGYTVGTRALVGQQIVDNQGGSVEDQGIAVVFNATTITLIPAEVIHLSKLNTGSAAQENFNINPADFDLEITVIG